MQYQLGAVSGECSQTANAGMNTRKYKSWKHSGSIVLYSGYMVSNQKSSNTVTLKSTIHFISNLLHISFEVSDKCKSSQSTFPFLWERPSVTSENTKRVARW